MRLPHAWMRPHRGCPRASIAQVRPPPQPCTLLGPDAGGSRPAPSRPGPARGRPPAVARPRPAGPRAAPAPADTREPAAGFAAPGGAGSSPRLRDEPRRARRSAPAAGLADARGGREAVTCRGLGRSTPAPLSWQPRQLHGGREPKGLVTAPGVHRARAGVDVEGLGSRPPRPRLSSHSALRWAAEEAAQGHQGRQGAWKRDAVHTAGVLNSPEPAPNR